MNLNLTETSLCAEWGRSVGASLLRARNLYQGLVYAKSLVCLLPTAQPVTKQSLKQELNRCRKSTVQMTRDEVPLPQKPPRLQLCSICAPKILFPWVNSVAVFNIVRHWLMNIEACIATDWQCGGERCRPAAGRLKQTQTFQQPIISGFMCHLQPFHCSCVSCAELFSHSSVLCFHPANTSCVQKRRPWQSNTSFADLHWLRNVQKQHIRVFWGKKSHEYIQAVHLWTLPILALLKCRYYTILRDWIGCDVIFDA